MSDRTTRECFVCGKQLLSVYDGESDMEFDMPPSDGSCWQSIGNYGSAAIDACNVPVAWEITICDDCLRDRESRVRWFMTHKTATYEVGIGLHTWRT